jgi:hypothetical protein
MPVHPCSLFPLRMQLLDMVEIVSNQQSAIDWARSRRLLRISIECDVCGRRMTQVPNSVPPDFEAFRCYACDRKKSIRCGSIFFNTNIPLSKALLLLYFFSRNTANSVCCIELDLTDKTVTHWFRLFRKVCVYFFEQIASDEILGGPGLVVEIDESLLSRRKYNRGRLVSKRWVFGAIERRNDGQYRSFVEFVEDRREATLVEIILRRIAPSTTIISDGWAAYRNLRQHGYNHEVINHSENFVDVGNRNVHTQNIENNWKNIKTWLRHKGTNLGESLHEYLFEYQYKKRHAADIFDSLVSHLGMMHTE